MMLQLGKTAYNIAVSMDRIVRSIPCVIITFVVIIINFDCLHLVFVNNALLI